MSRRGFLGALLAAPLAKKAAGKAVPTATKPLELTDAQKLMLNWCPETGGVWYVIPGSVTVTVTSVLPFTVTSNSFNSNTSCAQVCYGIYS